MVNAVYIHVYFRSFSQVISFIHIIYFILSLITAMFPQYCSPYNTEKRRYNEEQAMAAAAKDGAAAAAPMPPAYRDMGKIYS